MGVGFPSCPLARCCWFVEEKIVSHLRLMVEFQTAKQQLGLELAILAGLLSNSLWVEEVVELFSLVYLEILS